MAAAYHSGELAVQASAGARAAAGRVGKSIHLALPPAAQEFLRRQEMAVVATVGTHGLVWASLLTAEAGFMVPMDEHTLRIDAAPVAGDPLPQNIRDHGRIGLLIIDLVTRRRIRINGHARVSPDGSIMVEAAQVYANCPKYIQARAVRIDPHGSPARRLHPRRLLRDWERAWIRRADTFFVATFHPDAGADVSHRGGQPGFIDVPNETTLVWPDYAGNRLFQTLGNMAVNPQAGLLFLDFEHGNILQITGTASVIWDQDRIRPFAGAERLVEFQIDQIVETRDGTPFRWRLLEYSPFNPT